MGGSYLRAGGKGMTVDSLNRSGRRSRFDSHIRATSGITGAPEHPGDAASFVNVHRVTAPAASGPREGYHTLMVRNELAAAYEA